MMTHHWSEVEQHLGRQTLLRLMTCHQVTGRVESSQGDPILRVRRRHKRDEHRANAPLRHDIEDSKVV